MDHITCKIPTPKELEDIFTEVAEQETIRMQSDDRNALLRRIEELQRMLQRERKRRSEIELKLRQIESTFL